MSSSSQSHFHAEQLDPEFAGYRPVSKLAVVALLLGLLAATAFAHPLLWCVPLVGVVVSVAALVQLARPEVSLIGRKCAVVGLVFSLLFGVAAPLHAVTRDYWLVARARRLSDDWFARVTAGHPGEAYALMVHGAAVKPSPVPMHGEGAAPPKSDLEQFTERAPVPQLVKQGAAARPEFLAGEVMPDVGERGSIALLYRLPQTGEALAKPLTVQFNVQRRLELGGERWLIASVVASR